MGVTPTEHCLFSHQGLWEYHQHCLFPHQGLWEYHQQNIVMGFYKIWGPVIYRAPPMYHRTPEYLPFLKKCISNTSTLYKVIGSSTGLLYYQCSM